MSRVREKKTKTRKKPTREDKYNSKIHCFIVVWRIELHCIGLQCATSAQRPSPIFHLVCPSKSKNKSKCCVHRAPVVNTRETLKNVNECIWCVAAMRITSWATRAWINLKNLELELKWKTRQKKSLFTHLKRRTLETHTHTQAENQKIET